MGKGNPFLGARTPMQNPMTRMMQIANQARQIMSNPSTMADVLMEHGSISQEVYNSIKGKSPSEIGQYMMQNGLIGQQQAQQAYSQVSQVEQMMK